MRHLSSKEPPRYVGPTLTREFGGGEEERATTISLEASRQRRGSEHLAEKLCSFYLPNP